MKQQTINTHIRVIKIVADVLNSKPTDWKAEGIGGNCATQFTTIFHALYEEGRVENDCLPVVMDVSARRDVDYPGGCEVEELRIGADSGAPILTPIITLSGMVIEYWAQQT